MSSVGYARNCEGVDDGSAKHGVIGYMKVREAFSINFLRKLYNDSLGSGPLCWTGPFL